MTYADPLATRNATVETIVSYLNGLLIAYSQQELAAVINTASAAYVDYTSSSISVTVNTGEVVEIIAQVDISADAAARQASVTVSEDGVDIVREANFVSSRGDTNGKDMTVCFHAIKTPAVGAHTYKIRWKRGAAGTIYSAQSRLIVKVFQNS